MSWRFTLAASAVSALSVQDRQMIVLIAGTNLSKTPPRKKYRNIDGTALKLRKTAGGKRLNKMTAVSWKPFMSGEEFSLNYSNARYT